MYSVDFLPQRIHSQRSRRRRLIRLGWLLGLMVVGLVARWHLTQERVQSAGAQMRILDESWKGLMQQEGRRLELEQQRADLTIKRHIEKHLGSRVGAQLLLAELQRQLPESIVLTDLEMETKSASATTGGEHASARAAVAGQPPVMSRDDDRHVQLKIRGLAPTDVDVANFIGQLSTSPLFEQVRMGYARNVVVDGRLAREFEASCRVVR